jgi:hypothetical protein
MVKIKKILIYFSACLFNFFCFGQQIGNFVNNGSFELVNTNSLSPFDAVQDWPSINVSNCSGTFLRAKSIGTVPMGFGGYQYPKTGNNFVGCTFYCGAPSCPSNDGSKMYPKNILKSKLKANVTYCAKYHVVNTNNSIIGIDRFGIYFGGTEVDTVTKCQITLSYFIPQIENQNGIITDTLNWVAVSGTFVATGNEKYMVLGNFRTNAMTNTILINPTFLPDIAADIFIDDVSVIEVNLPAYAGSDELIYLGDSAFIGRQPDFAIDSGCIWYKFPNMATPIATISGLWVKPTTTSTYIVRQQLDCSQLKWDTVIVKINTNSIGLDKLKKISDNINLFPNPTSGDLNIMCPFIQEIEIINITNSLGQIIRVEEIETKSTSSLFQTSKLKCGLYQIQFRTRFGIVIKKFIKID